MNQNFLKTVLTKSENIYPLTSCTKQRLLDVPAHMRSFSRAVVWKPSFLNCHAIVRMDRAYSWGFTYAETLHHQWRMISFLLQFVSQHSDKVTLLFRIIFFKKPFFLECKNREAAPRNAHLTIPSDTSFLRPALTHNRFIVKDPILLSKYGNLAKN